MTTIKNHDIIKHIVDSMNVNVRNTFKNVISNIDCTLLMTPKGGDEIGKHLKDGDILAQTTLISSMIPPIVNDKDSFIIQYNNSIVGVGEDEYCVKYSGRLQLQYTVLLLSFFL